MKSKGYRKIGPFRIAMTFWVCIAFAGCSLPSLEAPECTASRGTVKEFYSFHFGNEMKFSAESLKPKEKFLTRELIDSIQGTAPDTDVFTTNTADIPKAFRVGGCEVTDPQRTKFEVILFWRDTTRSEERKIHVEVVKQADKWLINKILY